MTIECRMIVRDELRRALKQAVIGDMRLVQSLFIENRYGMNSLAQPA